MNHSRIVHLNGRYVPAAEAAVSVFDQGVLFGDGVFEGIRVYHGRIWKAREHVDRFFDSARSLELPCPRSKEQVLQILRETCRRNGLKDGYLRLVLTRGEGDLGLVPPIVRPTLFCIAATLTLYPPERVEKGLRLITAARRRNRADCLDPQVKSLNYLGNIMALLEARRAGMDEALMLNTEGDVAECAGDNIFIVRAGEIRTPPVSAGILDGITRRTVIELSGRLGIPLREDDFTLHNVYTAEECFLTGTAAEIVPVREVDGRVIGSGEAGPVTKTLRAAFHSLVRCQGRPIDEESLETAGP
jgi:branched-chain amino acid aminotransferase